MIRTRGIRRADPASAHCQQRMDILRTGTSALRRRLSLATALLLALAGAGELGAQNARAAQTARPVDLNNVPAPAPARKGFDLFAFSDLAVTGLVYSGSVGSMTFGMSNYGGPCSDAQALTACGWISENGVANQSIFEIVFTAGAPISDFRKVRTVYPGVNAVQGSIGYAQISNSDLLSRPRKWGPADNQVGRLFAGVATRQDGSCVDKGLFSGGFLNYGVTLMALSDCPETWPASGFDGARPIADTTFAKQFAALPDSFRFDFFRIPKDQQDPNDFLGDVSTYGETSDHYAEILRSYGSVTPKGSGNPTIGGFPLGLTVRFDAFNFGRPALGSVVFYQMTVVNDSKDVYGGAGVDFDSLYMGLSPGFIGTNRSQYFVPGQNALKASNLGTSNAGCNGGLSTTPGVLCSFGFNTAGGAGTGFAIVTLKSPIGDTRNKLLTRAGSPFFHPTSPFADDTITMNHHHICEFGAVCESNTVGANTRRGFGMMSSTEANVLDGQDPSSLTANTLWFTFRNKAFVPGQVNPAFARFNRFVPTGTINPSTGQPFGSWDYNNDDVPDTLFMDSCAEQGCVAAYGDTLPGKQLNGRGQVGGHLNAGPFKLKAGDTTSFVFAFVGSADSTGLESGVRNAIDAYMSFYLSPTAPTSPRIVSVVTRSSRASDSLPGRPDPVVILNFSNEPELSRDPFLEKYARDLANATADSTLIFLRTLNPSLADSILSRALPFGTRFQTLRTDDLPTDSATASGNFADVLIFKSCDNGSTFTATSDCQSALTRDTRGGIVGLGYQAYAILRPDAKGVFPKSYTDQNVRGGRTYLYSAVARSRGFMSAVTFRSTNSSVTRDSILVVADTVSGVLATTGVSTARVYVPISLAAGSTAGSAIVTTTSGTSTLPLNVQVAESATPGTYRLIFANQFRVTTVTTLATGQSQTTIVARRNFPNARVGGTAVTNFAGDSVILTSTGPVDTVAVTVVGTPTVTTTATTKTETRVYAPATGTGASGLGFVLVDPANVPYFISGNITAATSFPSAFLGRSDFPGFVFSINQARADTLVLEQIVQTNGDTVPAQLRDNNAVQFQQASSTRRLGRGLYQFVFQQDAWGPGATNFVLSDVPTLQAQVNTSLAERAVATTGNTSAQIKAKAVAGGALAATATLAALKFPFVVVTPRGDTAILAATTPSRTAVFGTGPDTLRITPANDSWIPGDAFVMLEQVRRDSTTGSGATLVTVFGDTTINGTTVKRPIQVVDTVVAFGPTVLGCNTPRVTCNPVKFGTRGATGYLTYLNGWKLVIDYPRPFTLASEVAIAVSGGVPLQARLTKTQLKQIRVVPNPYVVVSDVDRLFAGRVGDPRIIFTGVPQEGVLRIYSVSGQFLQQLSWTPADLNGTGDLAYDLRTREGLDLAAGLYIYVLTPKGANAGSPLARGKFVVIR